MHTHTHIQVLKGCKTLMRLRISGTHSLNITNFIGTITNFKKKDVECCASCATISIKRRENIENVCIHTYKTSMEGYIENTFY